MAQLRLFPACDSARKTSLRPQTLSEIPYERVDIQGRGLVILKEVAFYPESRSVCYDVGCGCLSVAA